MIKHGTSSARARVACRLYTPAVEFMNLTDDDDDDNLPCADLSMNW